MLYSISSCYIAFFFFYSKKKCYIALCMLYNKLYNLKTCYI